MKSLIVIFILIFSLNTYSNECIDNAFKEFKLNKYESAISQLKKCETDILESEDPELLSKYYYGLGRSYLELGIIDSAFKYELKSFNIKKSFDLVENLNLSYNDLGIIYNKIGLPHKSIFFLNNAIRINKDEDNRNLLIGNYLNLGNSYKDLGIIDSSEKYYLNILKIDINDNPIEFSKVCNNLGVLYQDQKNYVKSEEYFKLAMRTSGITEFQKLKYLTNLELTKLYDNKDIDTSIFYEYYSRVKSSLNEFYITDALFKLSITNRSKIELSFKYLSKLIERLKSNNNYNGAIIMLINYEKNGTVDIPHNYIDNLKSQLLILNTQRIAEEYGNELKINQESEIQITNLKTELKYANIGFYGLLFFFIFISSIIVITIQWFKKNNIIQRLIQRIIVNSRDNKSLSNSIKSELGKLTYMLDSRIDYDTNTQIFNTLDNLIHNVNNIDNRIFSNNIKEAECQILQHQQITNGSETL